MKNKNLLFFFKFIDIYKKRKKKLKYFKYCINIYNKK